MGSSAKSHGTICRSVYFFTSSLGTLKVKPCVSDQTNGWPSHDSLRSSGAILVRTLMLIGESFVGNKSLYHFGIPGFFCLAAGRGGSFFFLPLTILISCPD